MRPKTSSAYATPLTAFQLKTVTASGPQQTPRLLTECGPTPEAFARQAGVAVVRHVSVSQTRKVPFGAKNMPLAGAFVTTHT